MVKIHLNNTKHITIANIYIPPRDSTSTHYKTADKDIQHCIQHITTIPHSVLTGDVNAHSSLWHSYTDDHRGQLIAEVISNSDDISLKNRHSNKSAKQHIPTDFITRYYHGVQYTVQPDIVTDSPRIIIRSDYREGHFLTTRKLTGHNVRKTQS